MPAPRQVTRNEPAQSTFPTRTREQPTQKKRPERDQITRKLGLSNFTDWVLCFFAIFAIG